MEGFKGTPGPWFWERNVLCNKDYIVGGSHHEFNTRNRQLIAAAPELLEALHKLCVYTEDVCGVCHDDCHEEHPLFLASSAIAKALGK